MADERSDVQAAHRELLEEVESRLASGLQLSWRQGDTLATALRESLARVEAAEERGRELREALAEIAKWDDKSIAARPEQVRGIAVAALNGSGYERAGAALQRMNEHLDNARAALDPAGSTEVEGDEHRRDVALTEAENILRRVVETEGALADARRYRRPVAEVSDRIAEHQDAFAEARLWTMKHEPRSRAASPSPEPPATTQEGERLD